MIETDVSEHVSQQTHIGQRIQKGRGIRGKDLHGGLSSGEVVEGQNGDADAYETEGDRSVEVNKMFLLHDPIIA